MNFLFTCGGTAGHINPALAVAGRLREVMPESGFLFVGTDRNMEKELVPREGFDFTSVSVNGFNRRITPKDIAHNIKALINIKVASKQTGKLIREFKPDIAVGTGGYVCYPVLKKAAAMGIPTVIHESNAVPGLTTKLLDGKVDKIMVAFNGLEKAYKHPEKVMVTGTPVRGGFVGRTKEEARRQLGLPQDIPIVVSFWGSLGASRMNDIMLDFIELNYKNEGFYHIHAAGESGYGKMRDALSERGIPAGLENNIDLRPYIYDMPAVMDAADLVLCRAGASTISEITAVGRPAILVPSPNVTNNHQEKNAAVLRKAGGAKVIHDADCTGEGLYKETAFLVNNPPILRKMAEASVKMGIPDATYRIVSEILALAAKN